MQDGSTIYKVVSRVPGEEYFISYFGSTKKLAQRYKLGTTVHAPVGYLFAFATLHQALEYTEERNTVLECKGYDFHPELESIKRILVPGLVDDCAKLFWEGQYIAEEFTQRTPYGTVFCRKVEVISIAHLAR